MLKVFDFLLYVSNKKINPESKKTFWLKSRPH